MRLTSMVALCLFAAVAGLAPAQASEPEVPGEARLWDLLEHPSLSRREMLTKLQATGLRRGPELDMLRRMADEEDAHVTPKGPIEDLPDAERLAEYIWRLRDETGSGMSANGGYSFFSYTSQKPTTSDRIAAFGHAAVPSLLERLDDIRYTRLTLRWGRMRHSPRVLRIGQAALEILEKIADRPLHTKERCRQWWEEVQAKGEFMATADEMDRSDGPYRYNRQYLAGRLLRMNPIAAAPLVVRACRREKDVLIRKGQLDLLADVKGEGVLPFLRSEVTSGPTLIHRVAAIVALEKHGVDGAQAAMHAAWRELKEHGKPYPSSPEQWCLDAGMASLAVLLASTGEEGVQTLMQGIAKRPARVRALVAQALGRDDVEFRLYGYVGKQWMRAKPVAPPKAAEAALKTMLDDKAPVYPSYAPRLAKVRVADVAAHVLSRRFPKRYAFDIAASLADRDASLSAFRTP